MDTSINTKSGKSIRVVHIITGLSIGGAERMLQKLLSEIDSQQFDNSVISLTDLGPVAQHIKALGVPVTALNMKRGVPSPLAFIKLLYRLKKNQPDIVQTWMYHADFLGGLATKIATKAKLVWNIRHSNLDKKINQWSTRLIAKLNARISSHIPDVILCNSKRAIDIHQQLGYMPEKLKYIGNGFDTRIYKPDEAAKPRLKAALSLPADSMIIGMIGRYDPQKGHANFISAAQTVLFNQPNSHFVLAGSGVDNNNETLDELITQTGFKNHFHLLGIRDDMPGLLAGLDVLCLASSAGEGFPNVVGEAMACCVPCVVTDVGDAARIVSEIGKVVPIQDSQALAGALIEMITMPLQQKLDLGEKARQFIESNYSLVKITQQYQGFYQGLLID